MSEVFDSSGHKDAQGKPVVAITVDDGYLDFFTIAYPLLTEHGIPATFFTTVDFINQKSWFWFDKLKFVIQKTECESILISCLEYRHKLILTDNLSKESAWHSLADYCLSLPESEKDIFVEIVARYFKVSIPQCPPVEFSPVSWEQLSQMSVAGIEIGSHSLSHPVLSALDAGTIMKEILESKEIIEKKLQRQVKTIAYPFGGAKDYNNQVIREVKRSGYSVAVVAHGGLPSLETPYVLPRLGSSNDKFDFLWKIYGMEYILMIIRLKIAKIRSF